MLLNSVQMQVLVLRLTYRTLDSPYEYPSTVCADLISRGLRVREAIQLQTVDSYRS